MKLPLAEDAGDRVDLCSPHRQSLNKFDLCEMWLVWHGVDPSLKWSRKDGDCVRKGMQFGKASTVVDAAHPACILKTKKQHQWAVWSTSSLVLHSNNLSVGFVYVFFLTCNILLSLLMGGGQNHIMGLSDMVMIKDNHISTAGGIINAIKSYGRDHDSCGSRQCAVCSVSSQVGIDHLEDIVMAVNIIVLNTKTENDFFKNGFFC
ncbi:hypothetical protein SADUNF_Sadunf10G0080200 [Salix dunnii]|uniref:Quinolinate phosphoribosyl transferase C-terminal domain-containing protein n=1 Tax=Salix dunnii TaxID=1413687 RepID=A0A835JMS4_9ROSI|nr:hypothetical protein SADUNF_Sadunf10G0080200 [Salix dunnii]